MVQITDPNGSGGQFGRPELRCEPGRGSVLAGRRDHVGRTPRDQLICRASCLSRDLMVPPIRCNRRKRYGTISDMTALLCGSLQTHLVTPIPPGRSPHQSQRTTLSRTSGKPIHFCLDSHPLSEGDPMRSRDALLPFCDRIPHYRNFLREQSRGFSPDAIHMAIADRRAGKKLPVP